MFTGLFKVLGVKKKKPVDTKGFVVIDADGVFFDRLDLAYLNSTTATMCLLKFLEYCVPEGLLDKYQDLWKKISNDYIRYGYFLLNVRYTIDGTVDTKDPFEYRSPRDYAVKNKDDNGNASMFLNLRTAKQIPAFNNDPMVVKSQWANLKKGYQDFTGQIYMYNDSAQPYRITPMYSALNWMRIESEAGTYVTKACDNAMFGNNLFVMKKSSDATAKELEIIQTVKETLTSAKSVEETAQNLVLEWEGDIADVPNLINKISISNEVNVELFNTTDDKAINKICLACYGFPKILVMDNDGLFGNSGEAITIATNNWAKTCQKEAANMMDAFKAIGVAITEEKPPVEEPDTKTADAQAELRGTVGGGQLVLATQQAVTARTSTRGAAIALFRLILGFSEQDAIDLLGDPVSEPEQTKTV